MNRDLSSADGRPSPDALLMQAQRQGRGKLKIFLGAAPGVGKTWEMLSSSRKKQRDGVDLVIGVVETHGRRETEALTNGLPRIALRRENYKDRWLTEMDLDAILVRRPQLVLVDELAHSNVEGSRHPKRWQDVEEILAAGIDVYSTLNIQHIESLNGVVEQITGVRVRETVPDSIVERADELEVIDLTPEALMERLREGKVYQGDAAGRALANYFTPSNLTALRELALRRTAESVDEQLQQQRRAQGVQDVWGAGERLLASVNESPAAENLVRRAKRLAERLDAQWTVLYLETARGRSLGESSRDRVAKTLRLAEQLGAATLTLPCAGSIAEDLLAYAREHNCTQLVIGKSRRTRWFELRHGSVVDELVRGATGITVQVIPETEAAAPAASAAAAEFAPVDAWSYIYALLAVGAATGLGKLIDYWLDVPNLSLVYISAVLATAVRRGLWPSLFAAGVSTLAYNFFFIEPLFTFSIADPANVLALVFFAVIAVITSQLTASQRTHMLSARSQAGITAELLDFSRRLAGLRKLDELLQLSVDNIARLLMAETVLLLPQDGRLSLRASQPMDAQLDPADVAAATWCWEKAQPAGRGADTLPGARRLFVPLLSGGRAVGVIGVRLAQEDALLSPPQRRMLDALCDLAAIAVERVRLAKEVDQAKVLAETEKLRSALLTSVSHDLRTPLAGILGSLTSLRAYGEKFSAKERDELLGNALDETERMTRFIGNLLDMTRLGAGALEPKFQECDLREIVASARKRLGRALAQHTLLIGATEGVPLVRLDPVLMEQVLVNLLDNAAKYSPEGSTIEVRAELHKYAITISVLDQGSGIPPEHLTKIFELFHRVQQGDRQRAGIGLGLTVCRGFVEAMGGTLRASNRAEGGASFEIGFSPQIAVAGAQA